MYIKDVLGKNLGIVKFTKTGGSTTPVESKEYFVYGIERAARVTVGSMLPLPKIKPDELTYFLYDHLGNTRVAFMSDTMGALVIVNALDYYSYGKILREYDNGAGDRYLTTGHERDRETGLDYRGARYYDSDVARFLSLDPLAAKYPALSPYNYVAGNPIMLIDPDGREIRNSKGEDIPTPKHEKETRWTENHTRLNETFGDVNGFNQTIKDQMSFGQGFNNEPSSNLNESTNQNTSDPPESYVSPDFPGVVFKEASWLQGRGMTVGSIIYLRTDNYSSKEILDLKRHEYGHFLQFLILNTDMPTYISVIGLPSIVSAAGDGDHSKYWTETWANKLSYIFFNKPKDWNTTDYPLK